MNNVFSAMLSGISAFFQKLKQPWVLFLLLCVFVSVVIWLWGSEIKIADYSPLESALSRLGVIAVLFLIYALKFLRLKPPVVSPESAPTTLALPENDVVLNKFRQLLAMTFKHLKKSHKDLPWHIVVGYSGSGKSQLLKKSGLEFPFTDDMQIATATTASDIQIYINANGIFIDVPGYFWEDNTGKTWEQFVYVINTRHIRKNLASMIVTYSLSDVLQSDEEEKRRAYHANQLINKLQHILAINIPLYFVLTKADSLIGFHESFAALSKKEKEQVWGIAFDQKIDFKTDFITSYEAFVRVLNQKIRESMQREGNPERMPLMAGFPLQMASLKQRLCKLAERLFFNPLFKEKLNIWGIYFTSAEQNLAPVDHLFESLNVHYGLGAALTQPAVTDKNAYFVNDFFHRIVLANASYHPSQALKQTQQAISTTLGVACIAALLVGMMQWSYVKNNSVLNSVTHQLAQGVAQNPSLQEKIIQWSLLDADITELRSRVGGFGMLGFSQARTVLDTLHQKYHTFLIQHYGPLFTALVVSKINQNQNNPYALYQSLKVYLMLAEPSHRDVGYMIAWAKQNAAQPWLLNDHDFATVFGNADYFITPDLPTVAQARDILNQYSSADFAYSDLLYSPAVLKQSFILFDDKSIFRFSEGFSSALTTKAAEISRFYTPMGYTTVFLKEAPTFASQQLSMDAWVLGRDASSNGLSRGAMLKRMQQLYFKDYISHWDVLARQLSVTKLSSLPVAVDVLKVLSDTSSPLVTIINRLSQETTLTSRTVQMSTGGVSTDVDNYYASLHQMTQKTASQTVPSLNSIQTNLSELQMYLQNINTANDPDAASFAAAKLLMANSNDSPIVRLLQKANNSPEPVKRWLNSIVNDSASLILAGASRWINTAWQNTVYPIYQQTLSNRYPFVAGSRYSVGAADFNNFFGPSGVLETFTQNYIQPFMNTVSQSPQLQSFNGQTLSLSPQAMQLFQQANQIRQIQFSPDGMKGVMQYTLKAVDMSPNIIAAQLNVGNQVFIYRHDPQQFTLLQWPPVEGDTTVTLTLIDASGKRSTLTQNGDWALTQFLKTCNLRRTVNTDLRYDCYIDDNYVSYLVHVNSAQNPLARDGLSGLRVPKTLLAKSGV